MGATSTPGMAGLETWASVWCCGLTREVKNERQDGGAWKGAKVMLLYV